VLLDHEDLSTTALYRKIADVRTPGAVLALRGIHQDTGRADRHGLVSTTSGVSYVHGFCALRL